ncbi:MAG: hypothetical protein KGI54_16780 [Pseudomonadota bacterium]|nr:hypothetical protein [Pseudomonadota bacterium]
MNNGKQNFQDSVTSASFSLSLSANMVKCMWLIADCDISHTVAFDRFVSTADSLIERGLVWHKSDESERIAFIDMNHPSPNWGLTYAGRLVYELLKLSNLVPIKKDEAA